MAMLGHGYRRRSTVRVFQPWGKPHDVAGPDLLDRAAVGLHPSRGGFGCLIDYTLVRNADHVPFASCGSVADFERSAMDLGRGALSPRARTGRRVSPILYWLPGVHCP